jgi:hypothetical protein
MDIVTPHGHPENNDKTPSWDTCVKRVLWDVVFKHFKAVLCTGILIGWAIISCYLIG